MHSDSQMYVKCINVLIMLFFLMSVFFIIIDIDICMKCIKCRQKKMMISCIQIRRVTLSGWTVACLPELLSY